MDACEHYGIGLVCWSTAAKRSPTAASRRDIIIARWRCSIGCWLSISKWILRRAPVTDRTFFADCAVSPGSIDTAGLSDLLAAAIHVRLRSDPVPFSVRGH